MTTAVTATHQPVGPVDAQGSPRYAGLATYARLPRLEDVPDYDIAVAGVPFDGGVTYRPGARFGPAAVREASRLLKPYHQELDASPFAEAQVVDAGDLDCNPFDIPRAIDEIGRGVARLTGEGRRTVLIGGDHTIALPSLRAIAAQHGPVALLHFDAHLDTWGEYFGQTFTHGTPFRKASEEGLILKGHSAHVGIRGSIYDRQDLTDDAELGFTLVRAQEFQHTPITEIIDRLRSRIGDAPLYVSIDVDVMDPAFAPGTGTPEIGGLTSRELVTLLRGLVDHRIVGADVVEVAPAYDHAQVTAVAGANLAYEVVTLMSRQIARAGR